MEIKIYKENYDDLLQQNKVRWRLFMKKNVYIILLYAFLGLLILIMNRLGLKKGDSYWGFLASFGLSLILLSIFYFIHFYQNKTKYLTKTQQILRQYKNQKNGIEIKVTETSVSYKDFEICSEINWSAFSQYKLYDNYLFLIMEELNLNSIIIDRNDVTEAEFNQLIEFVKRKLPERK